MHWMKSMSELQALAGQSVSAIDTPALVIDLDAMERNLAKMQAFANAHRVRLRPHAKMHKCAALALAQMQAGAVGVCVQKTAEAEVLAALGVRDVYISNEVISLSKLERVAQLARRLEGETSQLAIAVDSLEGIARLAAAIGAAGTRIQVFIEIDVGQGRCGVPPGDAALRLAQALMQYPQLVFAGLQAYHGRAQHVRSAAERQALIAQAVSDVKSTKALIEAAGITVPLVTGAGTGTCLHEAASGVYGELQAGSYLFMDADYAANQQDPAQPVFEHALFVKSQVMSAHATHAVCDAGHKSHAIDSGLPRIHGRALEYANGGDEHGILRGAVLPALGDTIWLIPGHCDPTVNLHPHMIGVRGGLQQGVVEQVFCVDTRACLT
jgi:D-serine deaminase-like pyridoxal phosphate-dependent protein